MVISADCFSEGESIYYLKYMIMCLTLPAIMFALTFFYLIPNLTCATQDRLGKKDYWLKFVTMTLYSFFLAYPAVSSTILRLYVCKDIDGVGYLYSDTRVVCYDEQWNWYAAASIFLIFLFPIGIPCVFYYLLWSHRHTLKEASSKATVGFLYHGFTKDYWYWELVDMGQKVALTCIIAFFPPTTQVNFAMVIAMFYMIALLRAHPYLRPRDDKMSLMIQSVLIVFLQAGAVFNTLPPDYYNATDDMFISILLIALVVCVIIALLYYVVQLAFFISGEYQMKQLREEKEKEDMLYDIKEGKEMREKKMEQTQEEGISTVG